VPADLHVHTTFSDSTLSPEEVVTQCVAAGIGTVAITDHDSTKGVAAAREAGQQAGVRVVPGVEMTAYEGDLEIHIVGLFVNPEHRAFRELTEQTRRARHERVFTMVDLLKEEGLDITPEAVLDIAGAGAPGRPHVAQALLKRGQVSSIAEAFDSYIGNDGPAYVPKHVLAPAEAAEVIHQAGGVSIIAHPGTGVPDELVRRMIQDGVHGLEAYHPLHSHANVSHYLAMADGLGALVSGGSDSHGGVREGTRIGAVLLDDERVEQIESRARKIQQNNKDTGG
jgi:hypothetical protein